MLSGLTDTRAIHEGYQLGAHTFLLKPVQPQDVLQLIEAMQKYVRSGKVSDGYILRLVGDLQTSLLKKSEISERATSIPGF